MLDCDAKAQMFDAAPGFGFMHFFVYFGMGSSGGNKQKNFLQNQIAISSVKIFSVEPNTNVPVVSHIKL